jgi:hypothetical protein
MGWVIPAAATLIVCGPKGAFVGTFNSSVLVGEGGATNDASTLPIFTDAGFTSALKFSLTIPSGALTPGATSVIVCA